jgi:hypothetical protein
LLPLFAAWACPGVLLAPTWDVCGRANARDTRTKGLSRCNAGLPVTSGEDGEAGKPGKIPTLTNPSAGARKAKCESACVPLADANKDSCLTAHFLKKRPIIDLIRRSERIPTIATK